MSRFAMSKFASIDDRTNAILAALEAAEKRAEEAESSLAGLGDCINLELRENGPHCDQIENWLGDMRPYVRRLVDRVREGRSERAPYAEGRETLLTDALNGLVGLVQLVCARPDMPQVIRQAIADNHRWRDATDALTKNPIAHECGADCQHDSDCALHNAPAMPVGPCDCSLSRTPVGVALGAPAALQVFAEREQAVGFRDGYQKALAERVQGEGLTLRLLGEMVNRTKNIPERAFKGRANYEAFFDAWSEAKSLLESGGEGIRNLAAGGAQSTQAGSDSSGMPLSVGRSRPDQTATIPGATVEGVALGWTRYSEQMPSGGDADAGIEIRYAPKAFGAPLTPTHWRRTKPPPATGGGPE